ncbi:hypothetical protein [Salinimicrobium xinjiangense]|uniref:hypothetical protein n=1 Tax=Salinimicrobium xinjiangense TaxID=438596 RepID=UPI0004188E7D|nr:hypothetical protein [Salinimicrobium xinjiangense]
MKKLFVLSVAFVLFSCNSNENKSFEKTTTEVASNLELAKSTIDQIFENAHHYENKSDSTIMAPYGSKLSIQLDSLKSKLTDQELKEFNEYANKKFDKQYPQS